MKNYNVQLNMCYASEGRVSGIGNEFCNILEKRQLYHVSAHALQITAVKLYLGKKEALMMLRV